MISASDRDDAIRLIDEAIASGARQGAACNELELTERTLQRWRGNPVDGRPLARRAAPVNKLSEDERQAVLAAVNRSDCANLTPHQIVPKLADEGVYLASESTFYRVMREQGQNHRRGRCKAPRSRPPTTHSARGPNQVWCWDITWLPSTVRGQYFYWYMVKDIFSRKLIVNEVHDGESSENASWLLSRGCLREKTAGKPVILHSDNGSAMKGGTLLATLHELGVVPSYSRPRVSNDNAYAEALFRTAKYCPLWPERPFSSLDDAREWVLKFVRWYNEDHRHSALKYVTPEQRHRGQDHALLAKRIELYKQARTGNPARWAGRLRNWKQEEIVFLNPERPPREEVKHAA